MTRPKCILLDPPWAELGGGGRGAQNHYTCLELGEIAKVIYRAKFDNGLPVFDPAASSHLWMWVTDNFLLEGLSLIHQLQYEYKRTFCWVKMESVERIFAKGEGTIIDMTKIARASLQIGLGQYARGSHELLLLATRGKAMVPPPENRPPSVIFAPRQEHSRKPDESYEVIEKVSPEPRVEMFARRDRPGWRSWGDQL